MRKLITVNHNFFQEDRWRWTDFRFLHLFNGRRVVIAGNGGNIRILHLHWNYWESFFSKILNYLG